MEKRNEPLLLRPAGKDYLWGGKRLNDEYGKNIELSPLAETWECSTHPDGVSTVRCGTFDKMDLTAVIKAHPEYLGERHKGETTLPILVKLIDARKDLSVQVHPDDDYAKMKEHGQLGKTEMWYVLDAARDTGCLSIQNADRRCITVRTGWHFGYYCAWMAVARYPMMRELLIFIRETVCLCRRIQKSLRFTDRRSSLISEDKIQNSRVWGKTGR